jgi:hypothetical protein
MRARMLFAAGLVAALAGACSNPPADARHEIDPSLESNLDFALNTANATQEPVVPVASAIEAPRPPEAEPQPKRVRQRPAAVSPTPQLSAEAPVVADPESEPQLAMAPEDAEEPTFTLSPWPRTTDVVPEGATVPRDGSGETGGRGSVDDGAVDGRRPGSGRGPVIIIRGGVGERDPCAIHMPGRGGINIGGITIGGGGRRIPLGPAEVLINERVPRIGPGSNPVIPATGGGGSFPGRGPVFMRGGMR